MQSFTYTQLQTLIPQYAERTDTAFANQVPTFITLAENRLATDMKQQGFQSVVSGTLGTAPTMAKPSYWKETISFNFTDATGKRNQLFLRPLEYVRNFWPDESQQDVPRFYADYNATHFLIAATPAANYPFELVYYARLQPLGPNNDSNWLTINAPQALLAAIMVEACIYTKNQQRQGIWEGKYQSSVGGLKGENAERQADRGTVFTRP